MYVYVLKSLTHRQKFYVGVTKNLKLRLEEHNSGNCKYTSAFKPWSFKNFFWFDNEVTAFAFEHYLKSGSGRAFAKKHLAVEATLSHATTSEES